MQQQRRKAVVGSTQLAALHRQQLQLPDSRRAGVSVSSQVVAARDCGWATNFWQQQHSTGTTTRTAKPASAGIQLAGITSRASPMQQSSGGLPYRQPGARWQRQYRPDMFCFTIVAMMSSNCQVTSMTVGLTVAVCVHLCLGCHWHQLHYAKAASHVWKA